MLDIQETLPYEVKFMYDKIKINEHYVAFWIVKGYTANIHILKSIDKILTFPNVYVSTNIYKLNSFEYLKKLTQVINNAKSERKDATSEQMDIDIVDKMTRDAQNLRYLIQVENQDIYEVSVYISIFAETEKELKQNLKLLENICYANGFKVVPANFRQKDIYELSLPARHRNPKVSEVTHSIFTITALTNMFPFYSNKIIDENGIYIGRCQKVPCVIDFSSDKNNNKNMLVLGSSGAGKSYYIKHMILQYLYQGVKQIIIDPEGEYVEIAKTFNQRVVDKNSFNILEIAEPFVNKFPNSFLEQKIEHICSILNIREYIKSAKKEQEIKEFILSVYKDFNIEQKASCMYKDSRENTIYSNKKFLNNSDFPTIQDLLNNIDRVKLSKIEKESFIQNLKKWTCNNAYTEFESNIIVYDIRGMNKEVLKLQTIMEKINEHISENTMIYIDEMWQLIAYEKEKRISLAICDMFKTIRKQGAGIIAITQDISDILNYDKGNFGKSILNNCYTKAYFRMEYVDIQNLQELIPNYNNFVTKVKQLKRGSALIDYGGNVFELEIIANDFEKRLIEGELK